MNRIALVVGGLVLALVATAIVLLRGSSESRSAAPPVQPTPRAEAAAEKPPAQPRPETETRTLERGAPLSTAQPRAFGMEVRVVDEENESPIAGAQVRVRPPSGEGDPPRAAATVERSTDRGGVARFDAMAPAVVELEVVASGFAPSRREIGVGAYDRVETIRMSARAFVGGRVVDGAGHAVEGALVTLLLPGETAAAAADRVAQSDAAGEFAFRGVDLGGEPALNARLVAQHPDWADRPERAFALLRAANVRAADLVFTRQNPLLRGRVLDDRNEPLSGLTVHFAGAFGEREATTAKDGRFAVRVGDGAVALTIEDRCLRNAGYFDALAVAADRDLDVGDVVVERPVLVLSGIVHFEDGSKGRGVQLSFGRSSTTTDPDGLFRLDLCDVPTTSFVATWTNRDGQSWTEELPRPSFEASDLEIVLAERGIVVEAREDGKAIEDRARMVVRWRLSSGREGKDTGPAFGTPLKLARGDGGKLTGSVEIPGFATATFERDLMPADLDAATTITVPVHR